MPGLDFWKNEEQKTKNTGCDHPLQKVLDAETHYSAQSS